MRRRVLPGIWFAQCDAKVWDESKLRRLEGLEGERRRVREDTDANAGTGRESAAL